ncbi:BREX-1 system adenine-specific DNA-methyltransferase PglX [candidate division KSB1 bacterium]|nr:BREX-1 system adenine-specific DNA-methyltransferase PglX [candidate division KSB1 bacterium]
MNRAAIHDITLKARQLLMAEAYDLLEGIYGLHADGRFESAKNLPAIQAHADLRQTRKRLEKYLEDEIAAGLQRAEAMQKLVKEVAFTHLNRLVAFKMLEARKLVRGVIDRYHESNAFKFYLAEEAHAEDLKRYEAGTLPQNTLGEGPRDTAYRHFLLWQAGELAKELNVLFDPHNLASQLFPRPRALRELIEMLNAGELREAWAPGNEETIGWVYQFFNEEEKAEVFKRLYKQKQKIRREDIPAATQIFTPRWIVRFLVENTLGRLWAEMHPDSTLAGKLEYLVPLSAPIATPAKPVREIRLLDPACGTMHFGLVAFDLLVEMYREELQHAGEPGWPDKPSVQNQEDIPAAIIRHNLYGIDLDLRAVQLSALTLYLKAKVLNPKAQLVESHLACADIHMLDGDRLKTFLAEAGINRPIYGRILTEMQKRVHDADHLGSLLRLDEEIRALVEKERQRYEREGNILDFFGWSQEQFESEAGRKEFWDILEAQIGQALDHFARQMAEKGHDQSFFVGETNKGLRLLEVMSNRYDIVVTNPPYMTNRNMNAILDDYLKKNFPAAKRDLYTAFIQRCSEWLAESGRLGMITQQSFMFISSYEALRKHLRERTAIETMCHVGPRAFEEVTGEKVNTTLFVLRRETNDQRRQNAVGTYFRQVKEPDAAAKQQRFEQALARLQNGEDDPLVFRYRQADFDAIPGSPWVYWITPGLRKLFEMLPKLFEIAMPKHGMSTGKNERFLRFWWEVGIKKIGFSFLNRNTAKESGNRWFPYMKGGTFCRWYGNQTQVVNYWASGDELLAAKDDNSAPGHRHDNPDCYFRRGITWTDLTSGRFSARSSPGGFIFDVAGSSVFPDDIPLVLGVMNSRFAQYALNLINPTVHVQVGDLARLPIPKESSAELRELVEQVIAFAKADSTEDETTYDFIAPPSWRTGIEDVTKRHAQLTDIEQQIDEEVYRLYGISETDRAAIEAELAVAGSEDSAEETEENQDDGETGGEGDGESALTREELAQRWISYAVGIALGRFPLDPDSPRTTGHWSLIAPLDAEHEDDLARKVEEVLVHLLGEAEAQEILRTVLGEGDEILVLLRNYLARDFFKEHIQRYRKRPIYWMLQSPKKNYSVYLFHERITRDTLALLRGVRYLAGKRNGIAQRLKEVQAKIKTTEGREKKALEKEQERWLVQQSDLEDFDQAIKHVLEAQNERGETVGWAPELDDGVILNLAPLHELLPSWQVEPKKYWSRLAGQAGDFDWSFTAMRYWPERVLEKCRKNKSYAIAHGRLEVYEMKNKAEIKTK